MDKYFKYSVMNNAVDNQQVEPMEFHNNSEIKDITEQSTPKEMASFITKKLVEFIEQELKTSNVIISKSEKAVL